VEIDVAVRGERRGERRIAACLEQHALAPSQDVPWDVAWRRLRVAISLHIIPPV
jgi:hypothetical protein